MIYNHKLDYEEMEKKRLNALNGGFKYLIVAIVHLIELMIIIIPILRNLKQMKIIILIPIGQMDLLENSEEIYVSIIYVLGMK